MGITTEIIPVYAIDRFDSDNNFLWISSLERMLERFPHLEDPHKQLFYTILFIEDAEGSIHIDSNSIRLEQSKIICIKPGSVSRMDINRNAIGAILCFTESYFSLRYNDNVLQQFSFLKKGAKSYVRLSDKQHGKWVLLLDLIKSEYHQRLKEWDKVLRSYLNIILHEFERSLAPLGMLDKTDNKEEKIIMFEKLIDEHYSKIKTPSAYASMLNISTNYLNKLCQECRNLTAGALIRQRIVLEAQRLLYYTALTVGEISANLGFENASYFVTFFKKNTTQTPENYRKKNG